MKTILLSLLTVVFAAININTSFASGKKEKVTIQTTAQCGSCEKRITEALKQVDGFKSVKFTATKEVTVTYDADKTNPDAFRSAIAAVGYDADDQTANAEAYNKLPRCCQLGGH